MSEAYRTLLPGGNLATSEEHPAALRVFRQELRENFSLLGSTESVERIPPEGETDARYRAPEEASTDSFPHVKDRFACGPIPPRSGRLTSKRRPAKSGVIHKLSPDVTARVLHKSLGPETAELLDILELAVLRSSAAGEAQHTQRPSPGKPKNRRGDLFCRSRAELLEIFPCRSRHTGALKRARRRTNARPSHGRA